MLFGQVYILKHYTSVRGDNYGVYDDGEQLLLLVSVDKALIESFLDQLEPSLVGGQVVSVTSQIYPTRRAVTLGAGGRFTSPCPCSPLRGLSFSLVTKELVESLAKYPKCFRWERPATVVQARRFLQ